MSVADYNTDPDSNTSISGINIAEGCPPSGINNAIRQMMADIKTADDANVKLSGDQTVDGVKNFNGLKISASGNIIKETNSGQTIVCAGTTNSAVGGAYLTLRGAESSTTPGRFALTAAAGGASKTFRGDTDGTLTWDNKDIAIDENVVHKTGVETIAGIKVFSNSPRTTAKRAYIINPNATKGTTPSGNQDSVLYFVDNVADATVDSLSAEHIMAELRNRYGTTGNNTLQLLVYNPTANGTTSQFVQMRVSPAGEGVFTPGANGTILLGTSSVRWKEIWCTQSSINTSSDERIKQQVADIPDAVLDAWGNVDWIQFKYNDAVAEKGADKARLHNGLIAQRVDAAFKAHGLDAAQYGLFLYDAWDAEPEEKDADGNVTQEALPAGDAYGLRYTEALCMEAAYQRRRADRAEACISALERRLDEMEAAIAALGE